jgi:hypothetical protein
MPRRLHCPETDELGQGDPPIVGGFGESIAFLQEQPQHDYGGTLTRFGALARGTLIVRFATAVHYASRLHPQHAGP